ncbi:transglycosylase domain-containing protein [Homoserinibacter sp. YIM 151385]|uniref:transglycosylase domain-containing protein n=1 Tax=Homoserinibacter sp. YIM 151385 TaxID=2985506 RepID=UPI0022F0FA27|nr:transglycosylase domain-containing protein [Homoserinibacter sp. YIM 151385]WBU36872.1 transglycosylase domain-containing protein [Homoserinibacter sp. YIM 151385]
MSAQKKTASSLIGAALGAIGFSALAGLLVTVMVAPAIAVTGITANATIGIFDGLPEYIQLGQQKQRNEIRIKKGNGSQRIATIYDQNREEIPLDKMSDYLKFAAISGEDRRFYEHNGVDPNSVARAAVGLVGGSSDSGGASTLTMQTVRNILVLEAFNDETLSEEESIQAQQEALEPTAGRKLREMKLAIGLEKAYSKDEILAGYLNIANFGANTYGVQAAAQQYFSTTAAKLTPAQAASLIAIVQYPNARSLDNPENFERNQIRRDFILKAMFKDDHLTQEELDEAIATPVDEKFLKLNKPSNGCFAAKKNYQWFCDYVVNSVKDLEALGKTPEERLQNWKFGGYTLYGTLSAGIQDTARGVTRQYADPNAATFNLGAAAVTVQTGTGRILAMAQNRDFDNREKAAKGTTAVNYTADQRYGGSRGFQPGSTYKPYTLLAWLDAGRGVNEGFNAGITTLNQADFADRCNGPWGGEYKFRNDAYETGRYTGVSGTAASINSVFLQMASKIDQCDIRDIARSIGVHRADGKADGSDLYTMPSCVIGGCDNTVSPMTQAAAYAAIANKGIYCKPIAVDKVVGPDEEELPGQDAGCHQAIRPEVANTAAYAMQQVMGGTAAASNPNDGTPYIGKTGTTDNSVHTWMVGSSTRAATAVWVGNTRGKQPLRQAAVNGNSAALLRHYIFRPIAQRIDASLPGTAFPGASSELLNGQPTFVPDVLGSTVDQARGVIQNAELSMKDGGGVASDQPVGTIVRQEPASGASVPKGSIVTVFRSNGKGAEVPDVIGLSFEEAKARFSAFANVVESCQSSDDPLADSDLDKVVKQDPKAGGMASNDRTVTLTVRRAEC